MGMVIVQQNGETLAGYPETDGRIDFMPRSRWIAWAATITSITLATLPALPLIHGADPVSYDAALAVLTATLVALVWYTCFTY